MCHSGGFLPRPAKSYMQCGRLEIYQPCLESNSASEPQILSVGGHAAAYSDTSIWQSTANGEKIVSGFPVLSTQSPSTKHIDQR